MRIAIGEPTLHPQTSVINPEFNFVALDHPVYVLEEEGKRQIGVYSLHLRGEQVITQVFGYSHGGEPVTLVKNSQGGREDGFRGIEFPDFLGPLAGTQEKSQEQRSEPRQKSYDRPTNLNAYNHHPPERKPFEPTDRIYFNYLNNSPPKKSFGKRLRM